MPHLRIRDASTYLGVSDDTVRRWVENGTLNATRDDSGRMVVDGYEVALVARSHAPSDIVGSRSPACNQLPGLVTAIRHDAVMAQVEVQCGSFRILSLMSTEAVERLELELGSPTVVNITSTDVDVATPRAAGTGTRRRRRPSAVIGSA